MNEKKLYTPTQFGFRKNFSSIDALLYCTEKFRCYLDENLFVAAVTLDLSKAFDSINHGILTHKLNLLGFSSSACNLITSFLDQRIQKTVVNNYESDGIEFYQGVPQGTMLGSPLFNPHINDLRTNIPETCEKIQYADDTMLFTAVSNLDVACSTIERGIEKAIEYFQSHFLKVNADKTDLLILNKNIHNTLTEKSPSNSQMKLSSHHQILNI